MKCCIYKADGILMTMYRSVKLDHSHVQKDKMQCARDTKKCDK